MPANTFLWICSLLFIRSISAQFTNTTTSGITTGPFTTISSSSTSTITSTPQVPNGTTSVAPNGSTTIAVAQPTFVVYNSTGRDKVAGEYKLRTQVVNSKKQRYNGLYLGAWSVTPGYSADAAFTRNRTEAAKFYQNGTSEQLDFGVDSKYWGLTVNYNYYGTRWYTVSVHSPDSYHFGTFYLNSTGLQWTPNYSAPPHNGSLALYDNYFGGWIACDWWHDVPQLFYKVGFINDTTLPSSCAQVLLLQDYFR